MVINDPSDVLLVYSAVIGDDTLHFHCITATILVPDIIHGSLLKSVYPGLSENAILY